MGSTTDEFGHSKPVSSSLHKDTDLVTSGVRHSGYFCWTLDLIACSSGKFCEHANAHFFIWPPSWIW